ncbi:9038_t:CDS:2 [Gigaspora rosea]|nr:9038_t:CDS:2 [Gigaspora rosea]
MLISTNAKFHIGFVSQCWHNNIMTNSILASEPTSIRRKHVFTEEISQEFTLKQQWSKGFEIIKKVLDLGKISKSRNFLEGEMENEIAQNKGQIIEQDDDDLAKFASTISNLIGIRPKG